MAWAFWPARDVPSDARVARFVEEREESLDDRLVSAAELASSAEPPTTIGRLFTDDIARRAAGVDPGVIVPPEALRRAGFRPRSRCCSLRSSCLPAAARFARRATRCRSGCFRRASPSRSRPAASACPSGSPLTIEARSSGNSAPVVAQLLRADVNAGAEPADWTPTEMASGAPGTFTLAFDSVEASFKYRVAAGAARSEIFEVQVARAPRVARIDVEYSYPAALRMAPRVEEDTGDIYAPEGTDVRIRVRTDGEAATGSMTLANGRTVRLDARAANAGVGCVESRRGRLVSCRARRP